MADTTSPAAKLAEVQRQRDIARERLNKAAPAMLAALEAAAKLIPIARPYFPKSIRNSDRFNLELTCAAINAAIKEATQ
jgi:hypothetical protein